MNLKEKYPKGTKIKCIHMNDPHHPIPSGMMGIVDHVDDIGTIHMCWDNGSSLGLIEDEDQFEVIKSKDRKEEALERMKMLKLYPKVISEFEEENKINYSDKAMLFWANQEMKQMIKEWEKETGNLVYHAIYNNFEFGRCLSLFYVSKYEEEWDMDRNDINEGYPFVYVMNLDNPDCSEYGSIGIKKVAGGILRVC